ncbi:ATP-binding protein [Deinococcus frigens]
MVEVVDVDFKRTFPPNYFDPSKKSSEREKARAELVKDVAAPANAESTNPGYLVYGINDQDGQRKVFRRNDIEREDESILSSFLAKYLDPAPKIEYGEFKRDGEVVGLLQVYRVPEYPHVIRQNLGNSIYAGQVFYREGTSTKLALHERLAAMFRDAKPFNVRRSSEELRTISLDLQKQGWHTSWIPEHEMNERLQEGGLLVYKAGTRRPYRTNSDFAATAWEYLMKRRPQQSPLK